MSPIIRRVVSAYGHADRSRHARADAREDAGGRDGDDATTVLKGKRVVTSFWPETELLASDFSDDISTLLHVSGSGKEHVCKIKQGFRETALEHRSIPLLLLLFPLLLLSFFVFFFFFGNDEGRKKEGYCYNCYRAA